MSGSNAVAETGTDAARPRIWAVGGGKGGVGKSFISSSMGLALAKAGKRVVLVDLDLGGANLHTSLGIRGTRYTLSDYLNGKVGDINRIAGVTNIENLRLISGASDALNIANIKYFQKAKLLRNLAHLDTDFIILDLGAGTSFNTLDFFIQADHGLVSVTPDPGSVENTYRFLKCVFIRQLRTVPEETREMMQEILTRRREGGRKSGSLANFLDEMLRYNPSVAAAVHKELDALKLHIIVNQVMEPGDTELGRSMQVVCSRYFGTKIGYLGFLHYDKMVLKALQQRRPFLSTFPQSRLAIHMDTLVASLMAQDDE
ncbi:MAG: P-loop NTPase [Mariprofundaceae bacterium]|nr:P-loop NTPase [Mariprofundaceae bacterium]